MTKDDRQLTSQCTAISVSNLGKKYRLYDSPRQRLKEALHPFRRKFHRDFWALKDVSFDVRKGETVGIIGRNGCGKSTLLQIICGILTATEGTVSVSGKISALLELGAGFNPEFTGRENIYIKGALLGLTKKEIVEKLHSVIDFAEIGDFIDQPVKTYSSGMHVRLAFAAAINIDPDILIVDEALAVGDTKFQAKCIDKMKEMMSNGVTTLFVTHDMNAVNSFCSRAIMLQDGRIFAQGKAQVVTLQYYQTLREEEHTAQAVRKEKDVRKKQALEDNLMKAKLAIMEKNQEADYRYGTGDANIVAFAVMKSDNSESIVLRCGELFKICLTVEFIRRVENPCFGFVLSNVAGQNLLAVNTFHDSEMKFGPKDKGDVLEIQLETRMLLNPGKYLLSFGVADHRTIHDFTNIDTRKNVCTIEVVGKEFAYGMIHHVPTVRVVREFKNHHCSSVDSL